MEAVHSVEDRSIPGPACQIPIRIYRPQPDSKQPLSALVYYHGEQLPHGKLWPVPKDVPEALSCSMPNCSCWAAIFLFMPYLESLTKALRPTVAFLGRQLSCHYCLGALPREPVSLPTFGCALTGFIMLNGAANRWQPWYGLRNMHEHVDCSCLVWQHASSGVGPCVDNL